MKPTVCRCCGRCMKKPGIADPGNPNLCVPCADMLWKTDTGACLQVDPVRKRSEQTQPAEPEPAHTHATDTDVQEVA